MSAAEFSGWLFRSGESVLSATITTNEFSAIRLFADGSSDFTFFAAVDSPGSSNAGVVDFRARIEDSLADNWAEGQLNAFIDGLASAAAGDVLSLLSGMNFLGRFGEALDFVPEIDITTNSYVFYAPADTYTLGVDYDTLVFDYGFEVYTDRSTDIMGDTFSEAPFWGVLNQGDAQRVRGSLGEREFPIFGDRDEADYGAFEVGASGRLEVYVDGEDVFELRLFSINGAEIGSWIAQDLYGDGIYRIAIARELAEGTYFAAVERTGETGSGTFDYDLRIAVIDPAIGGYPLPGDISTTTGPSNEDILNGTDFPAVLTGDEGLDVLRIDLSLWPDTISASNDEIAMRTSDGSLAQHLDEVTELWLRNVTNRGFNQYDDIQISGFEMIHITGSHSEDHLVGGDFDDILRGGGANDTLLGHGGADIIDGGDGFDFYMGDLSWYSGRLVWNAGGLFAAVPTADGARTIQITNVEQVHVTLGSGDDDIRLDSSRLANDYIDAGAGDDVVNGGIGNDILIGGAGTDLLLLDLTLWADTINGQHDEMWMRADDESLALHLDDVSDIYLRDVRNRGFNQYSEIQIDGFERVDITGSHADDYLVGGDLDDVLRGAGGHDILIGNGGVNLIEGGTGNDDVRGGSFGHWDGGDGVDKLTADLSWVTEDVTWYAYAGQGPVIIAAGSPVETSIHQFEIARHVTLGSGNDDIRMDSSRLANDYIDAGAGDDIVDGGIGNDILIGGSGTDLLILDLTLWADTINGQHDEMWMRADDESLALHLDDVSDIYLRDVRNRGFNQYSEIQIDGFERVDITGSHADDYLVGGDLDDVLRGAGGHDILIGHGGVNLMDGGTGNDDVGGGSYGHWNGGDGVDKLTADLSWVTEDVTWYAYAGQGPVIIAAGSPVETSIHQFEIARHVTLGSGNDDIRMDSSLLANDYIDAGAGDDIVDGGIGNDILIGGSGTDLLILDLTLWADTINGQHDEMWMRADDESLALHLDDVSEIYLRDVRLRGFNQYSEIQIDGFERVDITGSHADDYLVGGDLDDVLRGAGGHDILIGNGGVNLIEGGWGNDDVRGGSYGHWNGGDGIDRLTADLSWVTEDVVWYAGLGASAAPVVIAQGSAFETSIHQFEIARHVTLGSGNDDIRMDSSLLANDYIDAGAGDDIVDGGIGNDILIGGSGTDLLILDLTLWADTINGQHDEMWMRADDESLALHLDDVSDIYLRDVRNRGFNQYSEIQIDGFERVDITGTHSEDYFVGGDLNDILRGANGADVLIGNAGDDIIHGGGGVDVLTGGAGADVFVYNLTRDSDRITDFESGIDRIDLSALLGAADFVELMISGTGKAGGAMMMGHSSNYGHGGSTRVTITATQTGEDTVLTFASTDPVAGASRFDLDVTITLEGQSAHLLSFDDFLI